MFWHIVLAWKKLIALPSKNALQSCAMLTFAVICSSSFGIAGSMLLRTYSLTVFVAR